MEYDVNENTAQQATRSLGLLGLSHQVASLPCFMPSCFRMTHDEAKVFFKQREWAMTTPLWHG